jgi:putative heme-binding domain-containing protein
MQKRLWAGGVVVVALSLGARVYPQAVTADHPGQYDRADIDRGSRLYGAQCVGCHGMNGDMVANVDLRRGRFPTAISDDDLVKVLAAGRPASGMPSFATLPRGEVTGVIAYIRAGFDAGGVAVKIGDPIRGAAVFTGKGTCASCHRVNGRGPHAATDLSDIGAVRSPASLQRALMEPASFILPANRVARAVTRDGRAIRGRRLNEDTFTIQIIDEGERLVSLAKADLRSLEFVPGNAMPSFATSLAPEELADVIGYLLSLKGL